MSDLIEQHARIDEAWTKALLDAWEQGQDTREIDEIASSPTTLSEHGETIPQQAQVNVRYGRFLYHLVRAFRPRRILEIGMANGISSAYMAAAQKRNALSDCSHVIIDPFQSSDWKGAGRHLLHRINLDEYANIIEDFSIHAIPKLEKKGESFDLAFIDGNHCLDYTLADVLMCDRVLATGGLLALDDSMAYGVKLAIPYLDRHRPNLRRIRFDPPMVHWLREHVFKRRRITLYQKIDIDRRGADGI